jgi:ribosomal protein L7/L12
MSPTDVEFAQLSERVTTLERAVEFLLAQVGSSQPQSPVGSPPLIYADVVELKRQGKMIEAIKAYRLKTNVGLAEAKQFVDNLKV